MWRNDSRDFPISVLPLVVVTAPETILPQALPQTVVDLALNVRLSQKNLPVRGQ
jgi:hypothetical protein